MSLLILRVALFQVVYVNTNVSLEKDTLYFILICLRQKLTILT